MKSYQPADIRNLAIVGHATSGKTMLAEAMLMCGDVIHRMGGIVQGSTVSDYHVGEQQRQISIHATPLSLEWQGRRLNVIDTPGYLDFSTDALSALRVVDLAAVVINAGHGIGVGTEMMWEYATQFGVPKLIVVNGLDRENVDFDLLVEEIRERFGAAVFPMQRPVNPGPGFNQVLDALRQKVCTYAGDRTGKFTEADPTGDWQARAETLHKELIEHVAESDDALLEKFFAEGTLSEDAMRSGLHPAMQKQTIIPLFCTAAESNVGVGRLLDFVAKFGSSPADRGAAPATDGNGQPCEVSLTGKDPVAYAFKTLTDPQSGDLSIFRVYSGEVHTGMDLYNSDRRVSERIGQLYRLNGKTRTPVDALPAGDIGAAVKLRDTHTGNTLCDSKKVVVLPKVKYPTPYTQAALKLNSRGDEDKLAAGLGALHEEDPAFESRVDGELHQTIIAAQGELHLEVLFERLKRRYKIDLELIPPRIRFRETIRNKAESKYRHKKQTGGAGQFAEVWMRIEPAPRDRGVDFTVSLSGQNVDRVFVPSVEKGVKTACTEGILAGYRVVDVKIDFYDGKMHPVDSKDIAFQIAGYFAFKEGFMNAQPKLLEPIYTITVTVPAAELYHYGTVVRSLTGGRGIHAEKFSHYEEMPAEFERKVVEEAKAAKAAANHGH